MTVGPVAPVTALADKEVYAADGRYVGRVVDIVVELETSERPALALQDVNEPIVGTFPEDAAGLRVPYRDVRAVGDVVVLSKPVDWAGGGGATVDSPTSIESPSDGIPDEAGPYPDEQDGKDRDGDLVP
ncbi:PRC-barrel domain-containing protein [Halorarum halophilum]|uniref:PRC-barrel domain-containing protein n=1 Tax=Halorarum halophilum TaxID=2743090 RepID=A0A7D5GES6_9EURY|nr:PRC-barrel domain-containing protein [Halobaculum halophilum]QLG27170.1 PRC-barrel domain-containing protein [Halobaculum halophilum]